ncbi:alpha/beta-hydrolase [Delitschia confertaspora ATCC 74209]|uniref:Alpha/beta-hydrolase n=1 Tax=Delitschia confertaspora ATCC 74209 TaxID=1513339 RepID=A0A9P4JNV1_9PLEO|nr:alpha/beta-hydrolase [Delitschia confertaspora ATCC 74209]
MSILLRAKIRPSVGLLRTARVFSTIQRLQKDPRIEDLGRVIEDEYAVMREKYETPKYAIVLAHGLLGFNELRLAGDVLPAIEYWRGIREALMQKGIEVIPAAVSPSGSIERRAEKLAETISLQAKGKAVNIIAGLDSRYMISQLKPTDFKVLSLTTVATPHRGSAFADYMFETISPRYVKRMYKIFETFGFETGAFSQLTRPYMMDQFNPKTPDIPDVRYYSYGASLEPSFWSVFALSHKIIKRMENSPNDGLVSVASSQWGDYKGTLIGVSHLDLINWTNRLKWFIWELTGSKRNFNAIAFYLDIADMLAKEGL